MLSGSCGTRDKPYIPPPGGRPFIDGRPNKRIFHARMYSGWDGLSGWAGFRKVCPTIGAGNGMQFPIEASSGNYIPESAPKVGHAFPLSAWRKVHPRISPQSGTHFPDGPSTGNCVPLRRQIPGHTFRDVHDKPRPNIRASVQAEAYKVHREFRTQRRPLNVASVLRRTVRAGNLICLRPDRRFSYELAAGRYLILVVPGARLGSVSLASVWKCSV